MLDHIQRSGKLLLVTKALRVFGFGFLSIILPLYLLRLGYSHIFIGIVLSVSIFSSVVYNTLISAFADRFGRGRSLILLSVMMAFSGALLASNLSPAAVVFAAMIGAMSVTGTETGPFMAIEQAAIPNLVKGKNRTSTFGIYNFLGYSAAALGALFSGLPVLFGSFSGFYLLLYIYIVIALTLAFIYHRIGDGLEPRKKKVTKVHLSDKGKRTILKLSVLFSIDAFGGGFILQSLLTLWFVSRYNMGLGTLSLIFLATNIITAISLLIAPMIAKRIGLLNTMVFTHIPSNIFLIAIPIAPTAISAVIFLFLRQSLSQMDVPTRQSYTMAIVKPEERTALSGITNIPRSVANGISPSISSYLIGAFDYSIPFFASGAIKIFYDILIFMTFRKVKPPEEK